jgi:hypothetical protein
MTTIITPTNSLELSSERVGYNTPEISGYWNNDTVGVLEGYGS